MAHAEPLTDRSRRRRAAAVVATMMTLTSAAMAVATVPCGGWLMALSLLPIGMFAGAATGTIIAGTIYFSGV